LHFLTNEIKAFRPKSKNNCPSKFYTPDHKRYRRPKITKQIKNNFRFFFYFFFAFLRIFQSQDTESIPSGETKENFNSVFFFFLFFLPLFLEQTKKVSFFQQTVKPSVKALYENDRLLQG
jgi:hypothetical protein